MKNLYLLFFVLFLFACSKEKLYGPFNLKNGQEVELLVDHRYASLNETLLILPQNKQADASLRGFADRKPGYIYRVKARFAIIENPPADGSDRWFDFLRIVSESKYQGTEAFDMTLVGSFIPGGTAILLRKKGDKYYIGENLELTYTTPAVKAQLEEIWQNFLEVQKSWEDKKPIQPKWRFVKATVTHDPNNFGKAYLVQRVDFVN